MVWRGDIADAYHLPALLRVLQDLTGQQDFLPWAYPPPFNLWWLCSRPCRSASPTCCSPARRSPRSCSCCTPDRRSVLPRPPDRAVSSLFITVSCGQNGFLTGTLIGLSCLGLVHGRASAGLPHGLMVIKPHLAVGVAVCALALRRWACLAVARGHRGPRGGARHRRARPGESGRPSYGAPTRHRPTWPRASYPLFRMVSVYASLRSLDLPAAVALAAQVVTAVTALGLVLLALRRGVARRQVVGLAAVAGLLVSPTPTITICRSMASAWPCCFRIFSIARAAANRPPCSVSAGWPAATASSPGRSTSTSFGGSGTSRHAVAARSASADPARLDVDVPAARAGSGFGITDRRFAAALQASAAL